MTLQSSLLEVKQDVEAYLKDLNTQGGRLRFEFDKPFLTEEEREGKQAVRPSAAGSCPKKLAYQLHHPSSGEELSARALTLFMFGDLIESLEAYLIDQVAYIHSLQKEVSAMVPPWGRLTGSIDAVVELSDGPILVDFKSANDMSFKRMSRADISHDYICQLNVYMKWLGLDRAALWVVNKNTSHRLIHEVRYDPGVYHEVVDRWAEVYRSTPDNLPERMPGFVPYISKANNELKGRQVLPWQCSYCPFTEQCWGPEGFQLVISKGKPYWIR